MNWEGSRILVFIIQIYRTWFLRHGIHFKRHIKRKKLNMPSVFDHIFCIQALVAGFFSISVNHNYGQDSQKNRMYPGSVY